MSASTILNLFSSFIPGSKSVDGGDCLNLVKLNNSGQTGIIAGVGNSATTATPLSAYINEVTVSTGSDTDGVQLPAALAGMEITVINDTANIILIWPSPGNLGNQNLLGVAQADTIIQQGAPGTVIVNISLGPGNVQVISCAKLGVWKQQPVVSAGKNTLPLVSAGLVPGSQVNENIQTVLNAPLTILNIAPGVPGYVSEIWMTTGLTGVFQDGLIQVYVDGEATPSIIMTGGDLGLNFNNLALPRLSTEHTSVEVAGGGNNNTIKFLYPIPFKSSVIITFTDIDYGGQQFFSIARYFTGVNLGQKLWSSAQPYKSAATYTAAQLIANTVQFLNLGAGNAGTVVFHSISAASGSLLNYLELNIVAYLNGRAPGAGVFPQIDSSGSEDYFDSSYYFGAGPSCNPWSFCAAPNAAHSAATCAGKDWLAATGGIPFSNGILMRAEMGQRANPGTPTVSTQYGWLVLYYQPNL